MALSAQQLVDVRRYCGYSVSGSSASQPFRELVYSDVSYMGLSLDYRLSNLSAEEETTITTYFLTNLTAREAEIQAAASNLDTDVAAVWTRNRSEVGDRQALFSSLRRELCHFLGMPPGPAISGGTRLVRC